MDTPSPVEFADWPTVIENDRLELVELVYRGLGTCVELPPEEVRLEVRPRRVAGPEFFAVFLSLDTRRLYRVSVDVPGAFRVLDEHGLTEIWNASSEQGSRPAGTTFRVRNHGWSRESELSFFMGAEEGFSYMVATDWDCLEIVCRTPPLVEEIGEAAVTPIEGEGRGATNADGPDWLRGLIGSGRTIDRRSRG
jgi:hypothetical protein